MILRAGGNRVSFFVLWGFLGLGFAFAAMGPRETLSLNTDWRFQRQTVPGSGIEWEFRDAWKLDFDDSHWSSIFIPHSWDQTAHSPWVATNHWRGIGWYRKEFTAPESANGHKVFLEFEGAFQVTKVWLNGNKVGEHTGGFTGFAIDITGVLSPGKKNVLVVSVDSTNDPDIPPGDESNVSAYGGLYRDVWLHSMVRRISGRGVPASRAEIIVALATSGAFPRPVTGSSRRNGPSSLSSISWVTGPGPVRKVSRARCASTPPAMKWSFSWMASHWASGSPLPRRN